MCPARRWRLVASILGLVVLPSLALAQDDGPAPPPRSVAAVRLNQEEVVRLDGVPDEPAWQRAQPAGEFIQRDPDNGEDATERTEVRVLYDDGRLLLGVFCFDREPDAVLGNQMQRDQSFGADDRLMITLDTFLDGRSGYYFEINPAGAMGDGLIATTGFGGQDLGAPINRSWDGIWTARVRRTAEGWVAEIELPFRTLNFDPTASSWGMNIQRTVRRRQEESLWTGFARNQGVARMVAAGRLTGLDRLSQGSGLDLIPYVVGNVAAAPGRGQPQSLTEGDVGLDAFYNITPALRANVSVNTDFAETEVDQRQVNLTRFPLFFEEKRSFFLDGSSYFDFAREGQNILPFFSRRIGLTGGRPQPIDVGAKLTGQVGAFDLGVLHVRTGETTGQAAEDFSVARVKRRVLQESQFGGIFTRRAGGSGVDLHSAGLDFDLNTSTFRGNENLSLTGFYLTTTNPLQTGQNRAYGFRLNYPNDPLDARIFYRMAEDHYDPAIGYVPRAGIGRVAPYINYTPRPSNSRWIRNYQFTGNLQWSFDDNNTHALLTKDLQLTVFGADFHSGDRVEVEITPTYELLEEDFEISKGIVLPRGGAYDFTRYRAMVRTSQRRRVDVTSQIEAGNFFSGRRTQYNFTVGVRPRRGVSFQLQGEHNVLDLSEGSFDTTVIRGRANTQFSPWVSLANNIQYDNVSRQIGWQLRFRWTQRPGNDLFVVYTHNWYEPLTPSGPARFETLDHQLATKLLYTLRF